MRGFWWFLFACDLLIPAIMLIAGRMMWKRPPREINQLMGYRTARSMKNQETWRFAHACCGRLWWVLGLAMLPLSALAHIPVRNFGEGVLGIFSIVLVCLQLAFLLGSIVPVERALKARFDEDGNRR